MNSLQLSGVVMVVGSILFLVAAFSPISRVYAESDPAKKLKMITENGRAWRVSQLLFGLGAVVTAVAVGLWALELGEWLASLAFGALLLGALLWCWLLVRRTQAPDAFAAGTLPYWPFLAYTLLTQLGLALLGGVLILLLGSDVPGWVGWLNLVGSVLLLVAYVVFKDMPPFVYYLLTLSTGVMFYWVG